MPNAFLPRTALLLAALLALAGTADGRAAAPKQAIPGFIVKVRDGDTVQMLTDDGRRIEVRLNAIDAPEKAHGRMRGQPHAERSRVNLAEFAARKRATLLHTTMDRYGRHVGLLAVETPRGPVDAGWWQVQSGYAWVYERYIEEIPPRLRLRYRDAQVQAREAKLGLWADGRPVAPWDWRQRQPAS